MAKFLLDTADVEEIKLRIHYIDGVTTNPILLERAGTTAQEVYDYLSNELNVGNHFLFFNQVINTDSLIQDSAIGAKVVYKVPLIRPQYCFLKKLKNFDKLVCGTMTYDITQLQAAINFGADYSIVLCHKNNDEGFTYRARGLKDITNSNIKLIGASFRTKDEVEFAIEEGMDYVTVPPKVFDECFTNEQALKDYNDLYT